MPVGYIETIRSLVGHMPLILNTAGGIYSTTSTKFS